MSDPILERVALLPAAVPDAARAARLRERCHRALAHTCRTETATRDVRRQRWAAVAVTALAAIYFTAVVQYALFFFRAGG